MHNAFLSLPACTMGDNFASILKFLLSLSLLPWFEISVNFIMQTMLVSSIINIIKSSERIYVMSGPCIFGVGLGLDTMGAKLMWGWGQALQMPGEWS